MKKVTKPIIMSALSALAFGSLGVAGTFALFTDKAETQIEAEAGIVNVGQNISIVSVHELGNVQVDPVNGVYTNSVGGSTYVDPQNPGLLHLDKWIPGDKVVLTLTTENESNVGIRTRLYESHSSTSTTDLYGALDISYAFAAGYSDQITESNFKEWSYLDAPATSNHKIFTLTITIEFPDGDNGDIVFDSEDNQYQGQDCTIVFAQQAVQGNAYAPSTLDLINETLEQSQKKNPTMYDALQEANITALDTVEKHYVWDSVNDKFLYEDSVVPGHTYFKAYKAMPVNPAFSVYAYNWTGSADIDLDGIGFDSGDATGFTSIDYANTTGQTRTVIIRSNDGILTVNAASDTVNHYNYASLLTVYAVANNSYHEYGSVGQAELKAGRLVVEEGGYIGKLTDSGEGEKEIVVNGLVLDVDTTTVVEGEGTYGDQVNEDETVLKVYTFDQFKELAHMCNEGFTYKGLTIQLQNDIDFAGKAWEPFGRYAYRLNWDSKDNIVLRDTRVFMGTLDGNNHKILNFSDYGYIAPTFDYEGEEGNPVKADANFGLIAVATGDVTIKNLTVDYNFQEDENRRFEGVGLVGQYLSMEMTPISKIVWNEEDGKWDVEDNSSFDRDHMIYELKESNLLFDNVKTTGVIRGYDGVAPFVGYNYGGRHPQSVDELGIYEWRSYKWAFESFYDRCGDPRSQTPGIKDMDHGRLVSDAKPFIENYAKTKGQGWYAEPFLLIAGSDGNIPAINFKFKNSSVTFTCTEGNCSGYAPLHVTYTFKDCENEATSIAGNRRAGIFFGKSSNTGSIGFTDFGRIDFDNCSNSGNAVASNTYAGIILGYRGGQFVYNYEGELTNSGHAIVNGVERSLEDSLFSN